jgi:hypothetical protein
MHGALKEATTRSADRECLERKVSLPKSGLECEGDGR